MKKWLNAFIVYLILALADGGLTLYNTPDLSREGNPLVTHLHLGWWALITVNLLFLVIVFFACRFTFEKYKTIYADVPNMRAYISQLFYNRPDKFVWSFYKFPKNWKPLWACACYAAFFGLCAGRIVVILEWLAVTFNVDISRYDRFRRQYFFGRFDVVVAALILIIFIFVWIKKEYHENLKQIHESHTR